MYRAEEMRMGIDDVNAHYPFSFFLPDTLSKVKKMLLDICHSVGESEDTPLQAHHGPRLA